MKKYAKKLAISIENAEDGYCNNELVSFTKERVENINGVKIYFNYIDIANSKKSGIVNLFILLMNSKDKNSTIFNIIKKEFDKYTKYNLCMFGRYDNPSDPFYEGVIFSAEFKNVENTAKRDK